MGEGRAHWSISNAFASLGRHEEALEYACKHLDITKETSDEAGQETAQQIVQDLEKVIQEEKREQEKQRRSPEPEAGAGAVGRTIDAEALSKALQHG